MQRTKCCRFRFHPEVAEGEADQGLKHPLGNAGQHHGQLPLPGPCSMTQSPVLIPRIKIKVMDLSLASYRTSNPPDQVFSALLQSSLELGGPRWSKVEELKKDNVCSCLELSFHILIGQVTIDWDIQ